MAGKPVVLVVSEGYLPGFKFGGPVRSLSNMISLLADRFNFLVLTADRDLGEKVPYKSVTSNSWKEMQEARVLYLSPGIRSIHQIYRLIKYTDFDFLYINGIFSPRFNLLPLFFCLLISSCRKKNIILAPRGAFSPKYLKKGFLKKKICIILGRSSGLFKKIVWHSASAHEAEDTRNVVGRYAKICLAPNISLLKNLQNLSDPPQKKTGCLRMAYMARIAHEKNLMGVLDALNHVKGHVEFNLYGVIDDMDYWEQCKKKIEDLPSGIFVNYQGAVNHNEVASKLRQHHFFCMLSFAENFGHSIAEALQVGLPVIISNNTPWKNLKDQGVGWDVPISTNRNTISVLQECIDMDDSKFLSMCRNAKKFVSKRQQAEDTAGVYIRMFNMVHA